MESELGQAWHETPERFRDALTFTASKTGFSRRLIEKDYYCSLLLRDLEPLFNMGLVFKGGTALSKVHADFYRLSEDLDFALSIATDVSPAARRAAIGPVRTHMQSLCARLPCLTEDQALTGHNQSRQYNAVYSYQSGLSGESETISFEVTLREPLLERAEPGLARTILINPATQRIATDLVSVSVMSRRETYAEKIRAALTRREPAIRDFYDVDHAVQSSILDPTNDGLLQLVRQKLAVPGNDASNVSPSRIEDLRRQLESQLRPVLRDADFNLFELDRVVGILQSIAKHATE